MLYNIMEEQNNFETTNINFKWLDNIYEQLRNIQEMERLAREGCNSLAEYMQMPLDMRKLILADIQYKNLKFMVFEINSLIINLSPILESKTELYRNNIKKLLENIDNRNIFLKETKKNNQIVNLECLPFFYKTIMHLQEFKLQIIKDIGHILYLPNEDKKKSW